MWHKPDYGQPKRIINILIPKKKGGLRLLTFFYVKESAVIPKDGKCTWSCLHKIASSHRELGMSQLFLTSNATEYAIHFYQIYCLFGITVQVELSSFQHCSSHNRKILRHMVHILKFLAWLSRLIKQETLPSERQWKGRRVNIEKSYNCTYQKYF